MAEQYIDSTKSYQDWGACNENSFEPRREIVLMQFTGLLDKNGKEIWEGDVLQGAYGEQEKPSESFMKGAVSFENGGFVIHFPVGRKDMRDIDVNKSIFWRTENRMLSKHWFYQITDIEVIGNVYENPELLK